jgi:hypothetical protein
MAPANTCGICLVVEAGMMKVEVIVAT